jgi:hypothetical protein
VVAAEPPEAPPIPKPAPVVDLTTRYKLTATGEMHDRKVATIDGKVYTEGDAFKGGLMVSRIAKDRVFLTDREKGAKYVIIFRYRGR